MTQFHFSHETASKVAEGVQARISRRPVPEKADTNPVSEPKTGRLSFPLSSTMESVGEVEAAAEKLAAEAGLDEDERFHVTMAVREAAVNAVLHGNEYDPAKQIAVGLENTGKALVFTIADQGKGLDPGDACPIPWRRKICCAAPAAASSSSDPSWMRYTFDNCIPGPN